MDWLTFVTELVDSLAWPAVLVVLVIMLRKPLAGLLPLLNRLKYGEMELEFNRGIAELSERASSELPAVTEGEETQILRDRVIRLAQISPRSALIETWHHVESALIDATRHAEVDLDEVSLRKPLKLAEALLGKRVIDEGQYAIIQEMRLLRNTAVHYEKEEVSPEGALSYLESARRLLSSLRMPEKP